MNTPKLDALLKDVEERQMVYHDEVDVRWKAAPRLAAMLRVAVEALQSNAACLRTNDGREVSNCEWKALAHMEQIAAESRSDDPRTAEEGAV